VHDLRHTAGTLATAAGGSLRKVRDRLGHSTTVAAVRYQHVMADRDAAIAPGAESADRGHMSAAMARRWHAGPRDQTRRCDRPGVTPGLACWFGVEPPPESNRRPHHYHGSAAKRRAKARLRRSLRTVGGQVMCSLRRFPRAGFRFDPTDLSRMLQRDGRARPILGDSCLVMCASHRVSFVIFCSPKDHAVAVSTRGATPINRPAVHQRLWMPLRLPGWLGLA
jgi:hypothetical protein